jgi:hypothetical protein
VGRPIARSTLLGVRSRGRKAEHCSALPQHACDPTHENVDQASIFRSGASKLLFICSRLISAYVVTEEFREIGGTISEYVCLHLVEALNFEAISIAACKKGLKI